ncbi:MAG: thioredoxin family protein [Gammaproteobacteria bacterium]|nr:MAG: thioredoxin family protein [Gammaproteobacteria bacterium]
MARTPSVMLDLGTQAPYFSLPEPYNNNKIISLDDFKGKLLVVFFICNHCPYVIKIQEQIAKFGSNYQKKSVAVVAINSNDVTNYPDDSPAKMIEKIKEVGYNFPYLFDESQEVAKAYRAACTPDIYLFNKNHKLIYRGQFDDARPHNDVISTGVDLKEATDALLSDKKVTTKQKPSLGCNIKFKQ